MRFSSHTGSVLTALAVIGILSIPVGPVSATLSGSTSPELGVTVAAPSVANRTSRFTDTFAVGNSGGGDAHNVVLTLTPTSGLTFLPSASDPSCTLDGSRVSCVTPVVQAGMARQFAVSFSTSFQDFCTEVTYSVVASVVADEPDLNTANNTLTAPTTILCVTAPSVCNDGIDNDNDGLIDMKDPGCLSPTGDNEGRDEVQAEIDRETQREQMRILSHMGQISSSSSSSVAAIVSSSSSSSSSSSCGLYSCNPQTVQLYMNASRQEVLPGDAITIVGHVQNKTNEPLNGVEVTFYYNPQQLTNVSGQGAQSTVGRLTWTIDLPANGVKELRIAAAVSSSVKSGSTVMASLRALGVSGFPSAGIQMPVVSQLPQTGVGFLGSLENTRQFLSPVGLGGGTAMLFIVLTCIKVLVAGGLVGRKFLARR